MFTPAKHDALPGRPFPAPTGTYPGKEAVADNLRDYAAAFDLPVELNARVTGLHRTNGGSGSTPPTGRTPPGRSSWPPARSRPRSCRCWPPGWRPR
jgi:hypothetical protein